MNNNNIVIEVFSQIGGGVQYYKLKSFPVSIGRGFDNDIILNDSFVSGNHLNINRDETGKAWIVEGLETQNGFFINDKKYDIKTSKKALEIKSGDCLCIGKTRLKIYALNHPISETQILVQSHSLFNKLENKLNNWILFFLSMAFVSFYNYLDSWEKDVTSLMALTALVFAVLMILWSSCWALAGRMNRNKPYFSEQIAVISIYIILSMLVYSGQEYIAFILHENILSQIIDTLLLVICFGGLLYVSLNFSTNMQRKKRFIVSGATSVGIMAGVMVIGLIDLNDFSSSPRYPSILKPYFISLGVRSDIASYMIDNKEVFEAIDIKK